MSGADPGLRFWRSYVEHHGGLVDDLPGGALAVLPDDLQVRFGLPETITVTGDPEAAREDGALLLAAGHPVLALAAETTLAAGDVGRYALAWPGDQIPATADLVESARGAFPVDHGRIDPAGAPTRTYLPVLRAGAMIRYTVAGDEAFQERAESWSDAATCRELAGPLRQVLESEPPVAPDSAPVLPFDLDRAVDAAHGSLAELARQRLTTLDDDGRRARADEIQRTESYYRDVLDGIARRRAGTAPDRIAALDARAEATRAERARRLAEIRDKHEPRLTLTPYRLQLVLVPAVVLPVEVKRGSRPYPQDLVWVWSARTFRPLPCPSCGRDQPLVAGKNALGCRACLTRPAPPSPAPPPPPSSPPAATTSSPRSKAAPAAKAAPAVKAARPAKAAPAPQPVSVRAVLSPARVRSLGDGLATSFWQSVSDGDRHLARRLLPDSPASTMARLFGVRGLICAVGIPPGSTLEAVSSGTRPPGRGARYVTEGELQVREYHRVRFPFALVWRQVAGRAVVDEILPYAASDPARHPHAWFLTPGSLVLDRLPTTAVPLDAVASALAGAVLPVEGLPLLGRCLTAWWRAGDVAVADRYGPQTVAAALLRLLSWRCGARVPTADCARRLGTTPELVKAAEAPLKARLQLSADVVW